MAYRIKDDLPAYGERINPPLYAWVEWEHYLISGDSSRFCKVLDAIEGLYNFIENHRTRSCGLYYFEDTGSSGMDNSPRSGYVSEKLDGSDVCFIDLACQQSLSALCMSKMYAVLQNTKKSDFYKNETTNFAAVRGLFQNGYKKEAREASEKFLNVIAEAGGIWECYSPEQNRAATREDGSTVRPDFVGWGGLFPITVYTFSYCVCA